jgi:Tfp pilus assembly protein PilF
MMPTHPAYQRGLLLYEQHRFRDAADRFRETLAIAPSDPMAHAMLSLCLTQLAELDDATAEARLAIEHDPQLPLAFYALALVLRIATATKTRALRSSRRSRWTRWTRTCTACWQPCTCASGCGGWR